VTFGSVCVLSHVKLELYKSAISGLCVLYSLSLKLYVATPLEPVLESRLAINTLINNRPRITKAKVMVAIMRIVTSWR